MIFRPDLIHVGLLASAYLALTGCAGFFSEDAGDQNGAVKENLGVVEVLDDARSAMREGRLADGGRLLDEALELDSENPAVWVEIARLRFRGSEHLPALEAADLALELGPEFG
ncbi:MAG: hypothetical protein AAGK02_05010, partial [Pseudomonadota bacterium]